MCDVTQFHPDHLIPKLLTMPNALPTRAIHGDHELRKAAVLVPIIWSENSWSLLYTRRSELLKNHTGQVAFPGGSADVVDNSLAETALRESREEIALPPGNVKVLGYMPSLESNSGFSVTPVVAWIHTAFEIIPSAAEVARVFTVPLSWLLDPAHLQLRSLETPWGRRDDVVFYEPFDNELVWGFTGGITMEFLKILTTDISNNI